MKLFFLAALMTVIAPLAGSAPAFAQHPDWSLREAGLIPMQGGGRVKPLDTFARETVLFITGSRSFQGLAPVDLLFSWISDPQTWDKTPFVRVGREDVRRQLGLDEKRPFFSPRELVENTSLQQYAEHMAPRDAMGKGEKLSERDKELRSVLERVGVFHTVVAGDAWLVIPMKPTPTSDAWASLSGNEPEGREIRNQFIHLIHTYINGTEFEFDNAAAAARTLVETQISGWTSTLGQKIAAEAFYNRVRPFLLAWIFYLSAALLLGVAAKARKGVIWRLGQAAFLLALTSHIGGIAVRCYIAGRPPVSNMYESIMWVSLGVVVFALMIYAFQRHTIMLVVACVLATLGLIAGDAAPAMLDPGLHPLVPVLRSNYWLTIHVLTVTLGYAAFALTLGLANVSLYHFWKMGPEAKLKIVTMNMLTYRAMQFGVVLLAAGTILGGVWADYSWGRFWGWDPKEVWALIALLGYLAILHSRFAGWVGQFGFAAWSVMGFLSVVMSWYGVNFILGVGLHSYGFSTGGRGWVAGFVAAQMAYVGLVWWKHAGGAKSLLKPRDAAV